MIVHPSYNSLRNDIALLQLKGSVTISTYVRPVCLPNGEKPRNGDKCYATGYGTTGKFFRWKAPLLINLYFKQKSDQSFSMFLRVPFQNALSIDLFITDHVHNRPLSLQTYSKQTCSKQTRS